MSNFRGRAPSGLINRETGNYAWVSENGYSNMGDYILRVRVTDSKGATTTSNYINIYKNADLFESTVFWVDYSTRYIGTYSGNGSTITITGSIGNGTPYQQFCGFDPKLVGKSLTWDVISNGSSIKSRWTQRCSYVNDNPVIDGDKTHKYYLHIIMNIPDNLPYEQIWIKDDEEEGDENG